MRRFASRVLATALAVSLAAACSFGGNGKDGSPSGGATDAGSAAQSEGGSGGGGGGNTDAGAVACPQDVLLTSIPTWKPSAPKVGACTSSDLSTLSSQLTDSTPSVWAAASGMISASCQKCVFSNVGDASWGVFVWSPNQAAGTGFVNVGGCYQALLGSSGNACGAAAQQVNACQDMACPATCQSQSSCRSTVQTGACGPSIATAQSTCGTNYGTFATTCSEATPINLVNTVCGAGGAG